MEKDQQSFSVYAELLEDTEIKLRKQHAEVSRFIENPAYNAESTQKYLNEVANSSDVLNDIIIELMEMKKNQPEKSNAIDELRLEYEGLERKFTDPMRSALEKDYANRRRIEEREKSDFKNDLKFLFGFPISLGVGAKELAIPNVTTENGLEAGLLLAGLTLARKPIAKAFRAASIQTLKSAQELRNHANLINASLHAKSKAAKKSLHARGEALRKRSISLMPGARSKNLNKNQNNNLEL